MAVSLPRGRSAPAFRLDPGALSFALLNIIGLVAYLHPFLAANATDPDSRWYEHAGDGPILFAAVAGLSLVLCISELTSGRLNSKSLAVLAVVAAMAGALRIITLPAGANLYFFLVIIAAYVFGPRMGFLIGALSFFFSAVVTGGVGPWLPFQVFAAAWMGLSAGLLRPVVSRTRPGPREELAILIVLGIAWGILFGAIVNLWFWPFLVAGPDISYEPGLGLAETLRRYWNFYFLTSFGWDLLRSLCNAVVILIVGGPLLRALTRFHDRVQWHVSVVNDREP